MKTIVQENLFPKVKFIKKDNDLVFDVNQNTICGSILKWLKLDNKEIDFQYRFWSANLYNVDKYVIQHRNNKIKKFKQQAKCKFVNVNHCVTYYF